MVDKGREEAAVASAAPPVRRSLFARLPMGIVLLLLAVGGAAITGGLTLVAARFQTGSRAADLEKLAVLEGLLAEFRELRERQATDAEWDALQARSKQLTAPMIRELEQTARRGEPAKQLLLWSAKYRLPEMFTKHHARESQAEFEFVHNLRDARKRLGVATPQRDSLPR